MAKSRSTERPPSVNQEVDHETFVAFLRRTLFKSAMGAVHGVYLKYVALSGLSIAGCVVLMKDDMDSDIVGRVLLHTLPLSMNRRYLAYAFGYSAIVNGSIALVSLKFLPS